MRVAFRADASVEIGSGHVMRCLALAQALRERGAECRFLCRALDGDLSGRIRAEGFALDLLPAPPSGAAAPAPPPAHAAWAGIGWEVDAAETRAALAAFRPDWLVVDHYAFDARWQRTARPAGARLAVLDDLADRPHAADLLLDQNLGREAADYRGLVPGGCRLLIGPSHALLRPEFAARREAALAARAGRLAAAPATAPLRLLVSLGGIDRPNATARALRALARAPSPERLRVTVVMGAQAPALAQVRALAAAAPHDCALRVEVRDMAALMAEADLALGAAGTATWERCCLGLPSLMTVIADNQLSAARAMDAAGAGLLLGRAEAPGLEAALLAALERLSPEALGALSRRAAALTDGRGAARLADALAGAEAAT